MTDKDIPATDPDLTKVRLFNVLRRGTLIHIHTEDGLFWIETVIEDADPAGGGVDLTLASVVTEGALSITPEMIAAAEQIDEEDNWWKVRGHGLVFRFEPDRSIPAFGPGGYFTEHPEAWEAHRAASRASTAARDAKAREQRGL
jgi:hypothetical protein